MKILSVILVVLLAIFLVATRRKTVANSRAPLPNMSRRFLDVDKATPTFPLPDCDAAQCNCKYARHEDRRDSFYGRRNTNSLQAALYDQTGEVNRRTRKRGRRKTDWD
jgi:hypothetical protein